MARLIIALTALLGIAASTLPADAYNCTTTCYGNTCYTNCN